MKTTLTHTLKTLALGLLLGAMTLPAQAQAIRTWVSGTGLDTNACTRTAPCATFAHALVGTAVGGEIDVVDAGDYGPVTIDRAVTIDGGNANASIVQTAAGNAILVTAPTGSVVTLRHLTLIGSSNTNISGNGIKVGTTAGLVVEDCHISGFSGGSSAGIIASGGALTVSHVTVSGCGYGIFIGAAGPAALSSLRDVTLQGNQIGLYTVSGATDLSRSLLSQTTSIGVYSNKGTISVSRCVISGNGTGVTANTGGIVRLSNSDLLNNMTGIGLFGTGIVSTAGNNRNAGNGTPGAPTPGRVIAQQ